MYVDSRDLQNLTVQPIADSGYNNTKTAFESLKDAWSEQRFSGNAFSEQNNLHDEYEEYIEEIEAATGKSLANPFRTGWGEFLVEDVIKGTAYDLVRLPGASRDNAPYSEKSKEKRDAERLKEFYAELDEIRKENPNLPYKSFGDIQNNILKKAEEWRKYKALGREGNGLLEFIGTTAAAMTDPLNATATLLTAPFTGGAGGTLLSAIGRTAVIEGGINMAVEAANQIDVYKYNQKLGNEYTGGDVAAAIAGAGIGGAALSSAAVGTKALLSKIVGKVKSLKNKGYKFSPIEEDSLRFAEDRLQLQDFLDQTTPYPRGEIDGIFHEIELEREYSRLLQAQESAALARGWDKIAENPLGPTHEILAKISPEDMEQVVFERGEWKKITGGDSKSGTGMVKFVWKHGNPEYDSIPIMKSDVVDFPRIVREFEPMMDDRYGNTLHWSVKRADGVQVIYAAHKETGRDVRTMVTIHTVKPDQDSVWKGIYSPKKNAAPDLAKEATRKSASAEPTNRDTSLTDGTTQRPYDRHNGSLDASSAHRLGFKDRSQTPTSPERDGATDLNITPTPEKVKAGDEIRYPKTEDIERLLADGDNLIPLAEVDGRLEVRSAREILDEIKKEDGWIDEINDCIVEFGGK